MDSYSYGRQEWNNTTTTERDEDMWHRKMADLVMVVGGWMVSE